MRRFIGKLGIGIGIGGLAIVGFWQLYVAAAAQAQPQVTVPRQQFVDMEVVRDGSDLVVYRMDKYGLVEYQRMIGGRWEPRR